MNEKQFATIRETARMLLLSESWLRQMKKDGTLPGVHAGSRFYVNVGLLKERLDAESKRAVKG